MSRWPIPKKQPSFVDRVYFFFRFYPLRAILIFLGLFLVFFSMQSHAYVTGGVHSDFTPGYFTYQTSAITAPPVISAVSISPSSLSLPRNSRATGSVSFTHLGASTDYVIRSRHIIPGLSVIILNDEHPLVSNGQRIVSELELVSTPSLELGTHTLSFEAYNKLTHQRTFLGTLSVHVPRVTNLSVFSPFSSVRVPQEGSFESFLTIQNSGWQDEDIIIESSSLSAIPSIHSVRVASQSSVTIPVTYYPLSSLGNESVTFFVVNSQASEAVSVAIETILPLPPSESDTDSPNPVTGLVTGTSNLFFGALVALSLILLLSKRARDKVISFFPKSPPPKIAPATPVAPGPSTKQ